MSHCVAMASAMIVVCFVYFIKLCCGQMFNFDLIEPPENPGPGMTYQKAPTFQMASDHNFNMNRDKNAFRTFKKEDEPDLSDLDTTLTQLEKWEDFEQIAENIQKKNRGKKNVNFEEDVRDLSKWLKDLKEGNVQKNEMQRNILSHPFQNQNPSWKKDPNPSPGMNMYWPDQSKKEYPVFPTQETKGKHPGQKIPVTDVMNMAKQQMREAQLRMGIQSLNQQRQKKSEEKAYVAPADDGIGPHARRHKRSLSYRRNSANQEAIPFFREDTGPELGSNPRDQLREFPQMGSPKSTANGAFRGLQPESFPQIDGGAPPRGAYPEMDSHGPMAFLHSGTMPQRPLPLTPAKLGGIPKSGGGPMPFSMQGADPPLTDADYINESPYKGVGEETADSEGRPILPGVMPQMGENGLMPFPQPRPAPQMGGNGPMQSFQPEPDYQMGENGPMSFPQPGSAPQMGGNGSPQSFQSGPDYQTGENGPMPFHQPGSAPQMGGNGPPQSIQPGPDYQTGENGPMPFHQPGSAPQMDGNGPPQSFQPGPGYQMGKNGPMSFPQSRSFPQMGGNGPLQSFQPGSAYQIGQNGPMSFPPPKSAPHMAGYSSSELFQPDTAHQMGENGPMPFLQPRPAPQMGGNGPMPSFQPGPSYQMGGNGPMPYPQRGPNIGMESSVPIWTSSEAEAKEIQKQLDEFKTIKLIPQKGYKPRTTPDDFNTPIKWVPMSAAKIEDGIAKVTDTATGRNFNVVVNGTIFVPVIDDSALPTMAPPTTVEPPIPQTTTENIAMKALLQFVSPDELTRNDWLGFDAALNRGESQPECDGEGCRARCHTQSCQSMCIGLRCISNCDGPGCLSMCIGDECQATCKGAECQTDCKSFSCSHVTNGKLKTGGGTWDQHYADEGPAYGDGPQNIKPPKDQLRMGPMYEEDYNIANTRPIEDRK